MLEITDQWAFWVLSPKTLKSYFHSACRLDYLVKKTIIINDHQFGLRSSLPTDTWCPCIVYWLRKGVTTSQPLWVILCRVPEKGRREGQGRKRKMNESEETAEIKSPHHPYHLQARTAGLAQLDLGPAIDSPSPTPVVCSTDRSKAVVLVLVFLFVALWFILRGVCCISFRVSFCSCFFFFLVLLVLRLPHLGKRELILVLFVRLFGFLSVSSSSWGLGGAAVCDCGTPWTFLLPFLTCLYALNHIKNETCLGFLLLDLKRAFDIVNHSILCNKLKLMDIRYTRWFESGHSW